MRTSLRLGLGLVAAVMAAAQGVDANKLLHPPADSWLTFHGDYSGRRHSSLTAITPENVGEMIMVQSALEARAR